MTFGKHHSLYRSLLVMALLLALTASTTTSEAALIGTGTTAGIFEDPIPSCPPAVCTGIGTNSITWGSGIVGSFSSAFTFVGSDFAVPQGTSFVMGTLRYTNGSIDIGSGIKNVTLSIDSSSADPVFAQSISLAITMVGTLNGGVDPAADADFIYFTDFPQFGSFRVFEGASTSVELIGVFDSLEFLGFGKVADPSVGFIDPRITSTVPEPPSVVLLGVGLGVVLLQLMKAKRPK